MKKFLEVIRQPVESVSCGECPVNMACVLEEGGTGWTFNCCHATTVRVEGVLLTLDCGRHNFEQSNDAKKWEKCPLCTGSIMEVVERAKREGEKDPNRYVRTIHATVPLEDRIKLWKQKHAEAVKRLDLEKERD